MSWRKNWKSTYCPMIGLTLALVLCGMLPVWAAERVALDVELNDPQAADQWVLPPNSGVSISGGEFIPAISHDILEFSARVLTQWAVSFPNALDA